MNRKRHICLMTAVFMLCTVLFSGKVSAASSFGTPYRILAICSYNYSFQTVPEHIDGLVQGLGDLNYEINYETMDAKTYYHTSDITQFYNYMSYKLHQVEPYDLVVLMDDTALRFGINYRQQLFNNTPMIFLGINSISDATTASALNDVTGIAEVLDYESNYELMTKMFPKRHHYVVLCDSSNTSAGEYIEFLKFAENHPDLNYTVINSSYYSKDGFARALQEVPADDSIMFCLDFSTDGEGNVYTPLAGAKFITSNMSGVPILRPSAAIQYDGILGGYSYSYVDAGKRAGNMARAILRGSDPDDLDLITTPLTKLSLEQGVLDSFGINYTAIPEDATIINERTTLHTIYRDYTLVTNLLILIFLLLTAIILLLVFANVRRNQLINEDFLTKVPNRTYLNRKIRSAKDNHATYGIIMVDLDNFKTINDTLGHTAGDELLLAFATRLKALSNRDVTFGRIGGDEFMGFMPVPSYEKADLICRKIVQTMSAPFHLSTGDIHITASIGCAMYPQDTDDVMLVSRLADQALYAVKESGKNDYRLFHDTLKA